MHKFRYAALIAAALFGLLIFARAAVGPLVFPVSVRTPINIESFCALLITVVFLCGGTDNTPATPKRQANIAIAVFVIVALVVAGFWRAIGIYFLADDLVLVTRANAFHLSKVKELLTTAEAAAFFRPLVHLTMAGTAQWAHFDPRMWRLTAVALHAVNSVLVFMLAARLGLSRMSALLAGALFGVHGLLPESVLWIAGWFGTLSTFFVLCGLILFLEHLARKGPSRVWYGIAALAAMAFALLTKETAYAFPLLALLLAWDRQVVVRRAVPMLIAFFAGAAVIFAYRWSLLGGIGGYTDLSGGGPLLMRLSIISALRSLLLRIWAVLYFPVNWSRQPELWLALLTALYIAALVWLAAKSSNRRSIAFAIAFVLVSALPPLEQLLIGPDLQKSRELYLPLVGFCLLLGRAAEALPASGRAVVSTTLVVFNLAALQHNIDIWRDVGETAKRTCAAAAACSKNGSSRVSGVPGSLDGVYFLGVGFPECVGMAAQSSASALPAVSDPAELTWNADKRELSCSATHHGSP